MRAILSSAAMIAASLALAACSSGPTLSPRAGAAEPLTFATVNVRRDGDRWTADFRFSRDSAAWAFVHSALRQSGGAAWRPGSWTIDTPGVRLERHGWYDVLCGEAGQPVPRRVRIRFTPFAGGLVADYEPALILTNGSVALFSDQFDVFPLASPAAAAEVPLDLGMAQIEQGNTNVTFSDRAGWVLGRGARRRSITLSNGRTYVLFGQAETVEAPDIATIIDPQLPSWLRTEIAASTPRILADYTARLGPKAGSKPMLIVSWKGPTARRRSMGGSVLPGLVIMSFEGDGVVSRNPGTLRTARWFIAHESAHFWLGETIRQEFARDAWISEGGADLLAIRAVAAVDSDFDGPARLQSSVDDCVRLTSGRALATAGERNENRAYYACGTVFGLLAEAAARRATNGDFFTFWRGLIEANRTGGVVTKDDWLAALGHAAGDPSVALDVRALIDEGAVDPASLLASLFQRVGIAHRRAEDGKLVLS